MAKDTKGKGSVEQGLIRELAELLEETGLSEIEIEREGMRVRVSRQMTVQAMPMARPRRLAAAPAAAAAAGGRAGRSRPDLGKHPGAVQIADGGHRLPGARARRRAFRRGGHARRPRARPS